MHVFYATVITEEEVLLDADESRHLAKVLRLNAGEPVIAIDGCGNRFTCKIQLAHPKKSVLTIEAKEEVKEFFGVTIAAAPTKNLNRWEWFLEKATEIGIDGILPFTSFHSERKILKIERQEKILVSATKQSHKATVPTLEELVKFDQLIKKEFLGKKYIAHCYNHLSKKKLKDVHTKGEKALILIGPEGDFSESEVQLAIENGFEPISLSESRLRTETAALVACHTIHVLNA